MTKLKSKKGFTLMEMLIVVAIVVILVAIAIPTMSAALDHAKTATDDANLRAAKAVATTTYLLVSSGDTSVTALTTGMEFDAVTGAFVAAGSGTAGESTAHAAQAITVTVAAGGYTVAWA